MRHGRVASRRVAMAMHGGEVRTRKPFKRTAWYFGMAWKGMKSQAAHGLFFVLCGIAQKITYGANHVWFMLYGAHRVWFIIFVFIALTS